MKRGIKTLGLALFATLAIGAMGTSAASANPLFHTEMEDTILTGQQGSEFKNVLTTDLGELECGVVKYSGTMEAVTTTTLTLKPKYENCMLGGENAVVTENGCAFVFHLGEVTEPFEAKMDIECPAGQRIAIHVPECTTTVLPQAGLQSVTFTNEGEGTTRSIIADLGIGEIHYVEHGEGCVNETEATENGTYTGKFTVTGEDSEQNHVGIWVE